MRGWAALLLAALLLVNAQGAEVPLAGHGNALLIRATVNGRLEGTFLLDTGATYCVLGAKAARRAGIRGRRTGRDILLTTANGTLPATLGEARRVTAGGASARAVAVAVTDDDPVPGLAGILGLSFLEQFSLYTVDREAGVVRLER